MKVGVIFFHKNIKKLYKERWINKSISSMLNQTHNDFYIFEVNYGNDNYSIFSEPAYKDIKNEVFFFNEDLPNYACAMNFILKKAAEKCDYIFNTNLDDYYSLDRIEKQLLVLKKGYDIVSSDFCYISEKGDEDIITLHKNIINQGSIKENLKVNHNIIAHPVVAYSNKFCINNNYEVDQTPKEDMLLWKKTIEEGFRFFIYPEELLFYRIHENQVSNTK